MGIVERDGDLTLYRDSDGNITNAFGRTKHGRSRAEELLKYQEKNNKTREYPSSDWLTGMLYTLMRDVVPAGEMERIIQDMEKENRSGKTTFSNGHLAEYAKELSDRIMRLQK